MHLFQQDLFMFLSSSYSHFKVSEAPQAPLQTRDGRSIGGLIMPERRENGFGSPRESDGPCS